MSPSGWLEAYNSKLTGPFEDFKDVLVILGIALLVVHRHIYMFPLHFLQIPTTAVHCKD